MNSRTLTFLFLGLLSFYISTPLYGKRNVEKAVQSERQRVNLNREWKFSLGDFADASLPSFSDQNWTQTHLPHSFSIPYFMWKDVYNGYGWYRKVIEMPAHWKRKQINVEFEGIFIKSEVFVNGEKVGEHVGGYTGFCLDITSAMKPGKNLLAVRVNNLWKPDVAPRAGDHQFSGGIYRDVYLHVTNPLRVAWNGAFVTTPQVSERSASVHVNTEIKNDRSISQSFVLRTEIIAPDGKVVLKSETSQKVGSHRTCTVDQRLNEIAYPALWSPAAPTLYKAVSTILQKQTVIDRIETPFGIRHFEWTADKGCFLNGKYIYLLGTNVHQDHAGWGDAVTNAGFYRDVKLMKEAGFNTIRGSHYPHDPAFAKACDELGMIFISEAPFWGMGGSTGDQLDWGTPSSSCYPVNPKDQDKFDKSMLHQLKEMIRIHRNNPSILVWSLSNEAFFTDDSTVQRVKSLLNRATDSVRVWDKSRLVAIGGCQRRGLDKLGKNQVALYNGDGATFPAPGVPSMVSEYGSVTTHRPGKFSPGWGDMVDGFIRPQWRGGQAIWCGFDHGTVGGEGLATMGIVDYFRIPKRAWHWYREVYAKGNLQPIEPEWSKPGTPAGIKLTADKTVIASPDGTDDAHILITIIDKDGTPITNEIPVQLTIQSGPGEFPTGNQIQFMPPSSAEESDITIRDGLAAIEFRSYYSGATVIAAKAEGLPTATLTIQTLGTPTWESAGKPTVPYKPYKRAVKTQQRMATLEGLLLAKNRPTSTSSTKAGNDKSMANDSDEQTCWLADSGDKAPWWKVDLEASYDLNAIELTFPTEENHRFVVEVSTDNKTWIPVVNMLSGEERRKNYKLEGESGVDVRAVRISFQSENAGLAEVRIGGKPTQK